MRLTALSLLAALCGVLIGATPSVAVFGGDDDNAASASVTVTVDGGNDGFGDHEQEGNSGENSDENGAENGAENVAFLGASSTSSLAPPRNNVGAMLDALRHEENAKKRAKSAEKAVLRAPASLEDVILHAVHKPRRFPGARIVVAKGGRGEVFHAAKAFIDFVLDRTLVNRLPNNAHYQSCMRKIERVQLSMGEAADVLVEESNGKSNGKNAGGDRSSVSSSFDALGSAPDVLVGAAGPMYAIPKQVVKPAWKRGKNRGKNTPSVGHPFRIVAGPGLFETVRKVAKSCYFKARKHMAGKRLAALRSKLTVEARIIALKKGSMRRRMVAKRRAAALRKRIVRLTRSESGAARRAAALDRMTAKVNWVGRLMEARKQRDEAMRAQLATARRLRHEFDSDGEPKMPTGKASRKRFVSRLNKGFDRRIRDMSTRVFQRQLGHFLNLYLNEGKGVTPEYHLSDRRRFRGKIIGAGLGAGAVVIGKNADRDYNPEPVDGPLDQDVRRTSPPETVYPPGTPGKGKKVKQLWPPGLRSPSDRN